MKHSDVLIIGGGIIGISIAYHLAKAKVKVVILEQDRAGAHASRAAAGNVGGPGGDASSGAAGRCLFKKQVHVS